MASKAKITGSLDEALVRELGSASRGTGKPRSRLAADKHPFAADPNGLTASDAYAILYACSPSASPGM